MIRSKALLLLACAVFSSGAQNRSPSSVPVAVPFMAFGDGSFENGIDRWGFWPMTPDLGSFEISGEKPHSGSKCARISIHKKAVENWHVQLQMRVFTIEKNNIYRLSWWTRGENDAGMLEVAFVKGSPPWTFYGAKKVSVTPEWKKHEFLFTAPLTTTDIQMTFQCASKTGDYYIDDVSWVQEGKMVLPEIPADWYAKSDERIEEIRKGDFSLKVVDKKGKPYSGEVSVKLINHEFNWGTCLNFQDGALENEYRKLALKHFNSGVFENAFKWEEYERQEGKPLTDDLDRYLQWGSKNNIPIRGHALIWGTENYGFDRHWARVKDDQFLKESMKKRITRDLTLYKGKITEYDVWNEPMHEPALFSRLGTDMLDSAFIWAHKADPDAKLYINEYSIISGTDAKGYRDMVEGMLKRGVPVHGIGVQGHFASLIDPIDIAAKLSYMGQLGLPIKVTEFDMDIRGMSLSDSVQASEYAKMLRTAFSHPAIEGFLFWGFWDARHWRPGAGLYDSDLKPKVAADSVYNLIHKVWTTEKSIKTDSQGAAAFRGFYGDYEVTVKGGKKYRVSFLKGTKDPQVIDMSAKK